MSKSKFTQLSLYQLLSEKFGEKIIFDQSEGFSVAVSRVMHQINLLDEDRLSVIVFEITCFDCEYRGNDLYVLSYKERNNHNRDYPQSKVFDRQELMDLLRDTLNNKTVDLLESE